MRRDRPRTEARRRERKVIGYLLVLLLFLIGAFWLWPLNVGGLSAVAHPVRDYAEALDRIKALDAPENGKLGAVGGTQVLTHGAKTKRAVILVHGYTNCPQQFQALGQQFYALGWNVLIPRMPHHGLKDRMTTEQARLTAEELAAFADETVDIAHGLGERVTMVGISAGGITTAWAAQHRRDLDKAVIISPAFGYHALPTGLSRPAMNAYRLLPNSFKWWEETLKEKILPEHAYPRYSTRALAQLLRFSFAIQEQVARNAPAAASLLIITNANDTDVNNALTATVTANWRKNAGDRVQTYEFPADLQLAHDLIDPASPKQKTEAVYPTLIRLINL